MTAGVASDSSSGDGVLGPSTTLQCADWFAYWFAVAASLTPVWVFLYTPTQDGPAHLANAVLRARYGEPGTKFHYFFTLSSDPVPNWTSQALLWGLVKVLPPLVAEKVLISLYVLGFAWAVRYLFGALSPARFTLAPAALLLLFPRCFFMGFYNSCLSLIIVLTVLGYCVRHRAGFSAWGSATLCLLFLAAYFTHLVGWGLAVLGAGWLSVATRPFRASKVLIVAVALLPTGYLFQQYLTASHTTSSELAGRVGAVMNQAWAEPGQFLANRWKELSPVADLFESFGSGSAPSGAPTFFLLSALAIACLLSSLFSDRPSEPRGGRGALLLLSLWLALLYFLSPDDLGEEGGYLRLRLVPLPALLWLACLRLPRRASVRWSLLSAVYLLVLLKLVLLCREFDVANTALREYTSGVRHAGSGQVIFVAQSQSQGPGAVNYLLHASDYYCLDNQAVNLDNYQASKKYFSVRYRAGIERGRGDFYHYPNRQAVTLLLVWDWPSATPFQPPNGWEVCYRQGRLQLFMRGAE